MKFKEMCLHIYIRGGLTCYANELTEIRGMKLSKNGADSLNQTPLNSLSNAKHSHTLMLF